MPSLETFIFVTVALITAYCLPKITKLLGEAVIQLKAIRSINEELLATATKDSEKSLALSEAIRDNVQYMAGDQSKWGFHSIVKAIEDSAESIQGELRNLARSVVERSQ